MTAILLAVVLLVSVVPVAMAKPDTADKQAKPVDGAAIDRMIEKLEPFVTRCDDGTFRLDIPKGAKINKTSAEFKAILAGMNSVNELIRQGELVTTPDLTVYSVNDSQFVLQAGINRYKPRWYGFEIWIDHETCQGIRFVSEAGGGVSTVGGIIGAVVSGPPGWVLLGVAAFLIVNFAIIDTWDEGCGIHMKFLHFPYLAIGSPPPIPFSISSQSC